MRITLLRFAYLPDCTLGWLYVPGGRRFACLSEPWVRDPSGPGGAAGKSCAPDGVYQLVEHDTMKHPHVWALVNQALGVYHFPDDIPPGQKWGRSAILIHTGNTTADTEGCLLVGMRFGNLVPHSVLESRNAIESLRALLPSNESHELEIRPLAGTGDASHA